MEDKKIRKHKNFKLSEEVEAALIEIQDYYKEELRSTSFFFGDLNISQNRTLERIILEKRDQLLNGSKETAAGKQQGKNIIDKYK